MPLSSTDFVQLQQRIFRSGFITLNSALCRIVCQKPRSAEIPTGEPEPSSVPRSTVGAIMDGGFDIRNVLHRGFPERGFPNGPAIDRFHASDSFSKISVLRLGVIFIRSREQSLIRISKHQGQSSYRFLRTVTVLLRPKACPCIHLQSWKEEAPAA